MLAEKRTQHHFAAAFPAALPMILDDILQENGAAVWPAASDIDVHQDAALVLTAVRQENHTPCVLRIATFKPIPLRLSSISISARQVSDGHTAVLLLLFRNLASTHTSKLGRLASLVEQFRLS